jgi:hypothetical protein
MCSRKCLGTKTDVTYVVGVSSSLVVLILIYNSVCLLAKKRSEFFLYVFSLCIYTGDILGTELGVILMRWVGYVMFYLSMEFKGESERYTVFTDFPFFIPYYHHHYYYYYYLQPNH